MKLPRLFRRAAAEQRGSIEDPHVPISSDAVLQVFGLRDAIADIQVTTELALSVPAVACAVNFMAGTIASLPLQTYRRTSMGREKLDTPLAKMLQHAVNPGCTSYDWRKYSFDTVFTDGRSVSFIERDSAGRPVNIWPLDWSNGTVRRRDGRITYEYRENGRTVVYEASEVIDLMFMRKRDMISHRSPVKMARDAIALAKAMETYGGSLFNNGGVPPMQLVSTITSPEGIRRASKDIDEAIQETQRTRRKTVAIPIGHELKPIGVDPEKSQMEAARRFQIEEFARVWNLPPAFMQDLTHGTFSNTEQQDLHYVKHTLTRWITMFEQELNLKLFGPRAAQRFVRLNVDGLLRGDYKTRMEGHAKAVQNALMTPNEGRAMENWPSVDGGDELLIQGATVPLGQQPATGNGGNNNAET